MGHPWRASRGSVNTITAYNPTFLLEYVLYINKKWWQKKNISLVNDDERPARPVEHILVVKKIKSVKTIPKIRLWRAASLASQTEPVPRESRGWP